MTIIVIRPMYFKGDVTSIDKIDSNGAVQNFTYCTENFFYMKKQYLAIGPTIKKTTIKLFLC